MPNLHSLSPHPSMQTSPPPHLVRRLPRLLCSALLLLCSAARGPQLLLQPGSLRLGGAGLKLMVACGGCPLLPQPPKLLLCKGASERGSQWAVGEGDVIQ